MLQLPRDFVRHIAAHLRMRLTKSVRLFSSDLQFPSPLFLLFVILIKAGFLLSQSQSWHKTKCYTNFYRLNAHFV